MGAFYMRFQNSIDNHSTNAPKESNVFFDKTKTGKTRPWRERKIDTDDEERNLQIVKDLEEGLFRKRLISYGGLLKEIHKELNLDDAEDGDLVKVNEENDDEKEDEGFTVTAMWNWNRQNYYIKND